MLTSQAIQHCLDLSASANDLPLDGPSGNLRDPSNAVYLQLTINELSPTSAVKPVRINLPHAAAHAGRRKRLSVGKRSAEGV